MNIYITGASGMLGSAVLKSIDAVPIVRKPCELKNEIISDFSSKHLKEILKDADVVIHLAGSRDFLDKKKAWEGNVELTRKIVDAMPESAKIIFSSSISVYGKKLAEIIAEKKSDSTYGLLRIYELKADYLIVEDTSVDQDVLKSAPAHPPLKFMPIQSNLNELYELSDIVDSIQNKRP